MSIRVSEKHGVNPAIPTCYFCREDKNEVILAGKLSGDAEAPRGAVWDMNPCDKCKALMQQGIMVIAVKDGEAELMQADLEAYQASRNDVARHRNYKYSSFVPNPYRTGSLWVVKDKAFNQVLAGSNMSKLDIDQIMQRRWLFLEDSSCQQIGLEVSGEDNARV